MFERLKSFLQPSSQTLQEPKKRPVIITIHGYGRRRKHEMDNLVLWAEHEHHEYEIVQFDLYDLFDETDCDWKQWVARAKTKINEYELNDRDIYLIGFSMGGVIAAYLAATSPHVKKLVLLAPAFHYLHMEAITNVITKSAVSFFTNEDKEDKKLEVEIPRSFYSAFMDVVKHLKPYIAQVRCPVLILHGDEDEVIPVKSSIYAYDKIPHKEKKLILLHEGHHRLLMDERVNWEVYQLMRLFFENQILNGKTIPQAEDILLQYEKELLEKQAATHSIQEEQTKQES